MTPTEKLIEEGVAASMAVRTEVAALRTILTDYEQVIATQTAAIRELASARRSDREILVKILDACTRDGDSTMADAIRHIEAGVSTVVENTQVIRDAVTAKADAPAPVSPA